ncbi:tRNA (adenosine(37)-N6)-dimethylallyltransferase MiaA [Nocardioides donggukensis]|uniref:tRNA dimethylallyltransferase n=1 Tax=Nocardioides donggukensis TaxID=2774019 RepID=A0A927K514_9ACTN|nr:tRNA (adenosine(37)-N6)-dimethylallyltransferase MiaA [Nocardioides donggukensis]MBD8870654.1 tRNA (adenosine(37)-N6)-dimethylallyltransferase MiaA [Nocardioides donggukensis]
MTGRRALPPVVAVVGATASGKTDLSLDLAERLGGQIVNTDAMQVYRGMDIGTAKLPPAQRRGITHHLLDLMEVTETASVAQFQTMARSVIADLRSQGIVPVLVGGSALYTRAVLDHFTFPGTDPDVRGALEQELAEVGSGVLHRRLAERDPAAASGILPSNGRRVVRALEVIELTGRPFSASLPRLEYALPQAHQIGVAVDRETLDRRIAARVEAMFDAGLVAEVADLRERGLAGSRTASRAIGYAEVLRHLAGEIGEDEAREATRVATRRFARKQDSWFHKDPRITWVDGLDPSRLADAVAALPALPALPPGPPGPLAG